MTKRTLLLVAAVLSSPFLLGDQPPQQDCSRPRYVMDRTQRITAKHREANGIGYQTGYTSLEGFFSTSKTPTLIGFADVRAHVFNDSKKAYNLGLGFRKLSEPYHLVFGANVFYDYRDARHRAFNQIGVGLEVLGTKWDLRANGYIPVHHTKKKYRDEFLKFKGSSAIFTKRYEFAFVGAELALGRELVKMKNWDLHAKLSAYWFNGDFGKNAGGGLFELSTNITRYLTLKGQASYDTLFRGVFQGEAAINIPFGQKFEKRDSTLSCETLKDLEDRLVETVDRFEIIVTSIKRKKAAALDPLTGQPLTFIFVNNTSHSLGTFESPYPTIAQAITASQPNNVIYVFPGDGTSTGMNAGPYNLKNNQKFIGSAAPLTVTTAFGTRTIPAQSTTAPLLSSSTIVGLADNNQVSGFKMINASNAIFNNNATTSGFEVSFNDINATSNCITVGTFDHVANIHDNIFRGITATGVAVEPTDINGLTNISNNLFLVNSAIVASTGTESVGTNTFNIVGNTIIGMGTTPIGITVTSSTNGASSSIFKGTVAGNSVQNCFQGMNLQTTSAGSVLEVEVVKNIVLNSTSFGIQIQSVSGSSIFADVVSNTMQNTNPAAKGFVMTTAGTDTLRLVDNNAVLANPGYSLSATGVLNVESPNSQLTGVQALNLGTFAAPTGTVQFVPFTFAPLF